MHYYIDGYNLMFRMMKAADDLARQRELLITEIFKKISFVGLDVTIVFDSQYNPSESTRSNLREMSIYFTDHQETADEYILTELKNDPVPSAHTVVTSDRKLSYLSRLRGAKAETVESFMELLNKRYKNKLRNKDSLKTKPIIPPVKKSDPTPASSVEECQDYYLSQFEKLWEEMVKNEPPPKPLKVIKEKSKKKKPKKAPQSERSILDHWTKAFERDASLDEID